MINDENVLFKINFYFQEKKEIQLFSKINCLKKKKFMESYIYGIDFI